MTVARITEISSISTKSFEDAIVQGVDRANLTVSQEKFRACSAAAGALPESRDQFVAEAMA